MSKALCIISFLAISIFAILPSSTLAGNNLCTQTTIEVDPNTFNTKVTLDTKIDITKNQPVLTGSNIIMTLNTGDRANAVVQDNGLTFFLFGKLAPGDYTFLLTIDGKNTCTRADDKAIFNIPNIDQGGSTEICEVSKGNLEITPASPRVTDPIKVIIKNLPEDTDYFVSVTDHNRIRPVRENQYKCQTSSDKILDISFKPLLEATWDITVLKKATGSNCVGFGPPVACAKITMDTTKVRTIPPPTECTGENCTSSGGIPCDATNGKRPDENETFREFLQKIPAENSGIWTAVGCIPTQPTKLIESLLKLATGIGGGVALLLFIAGTFQMITSAGNPDGVKKGSEQMTAAIIGLLFIIFSVMLLKIIGVDILQIPGFEK